MKISHKALAMTEVLTASLSYFFPCSFNILSVLYIWFLSIRTLYATLFQILMGLLFFSIIHCNIFITLVVCEQSVH